jgi:hypothetical protein
MSDAQHPWGPRPTLEGRRFVAVVNGSGEVGAETVFTYHEDTAAGTVWADYAGGVIVRGHLMGHRGRSPDGSDTLDFRYVQIKADGTTSSGRCESVIEMLTDGRLRLHETWAWESRDGSGTSTVEELPPSAD